MDNKKRCKWCNLKNPKYIEYHDNEWCKPNFNDKYLYEMLILESFQAGLSWECVLNKRESFRKAYDNFDIDKVVSYDETKVNELINNKDKNGITHKYFQLLVFTYFSISSDFCGIQIRTFPSQSGSATNSIRFTTVGAISIIFASPISLPASKPSPLMIIGMVISSGISKPWVLSCPPWSAVMITA